MVEPIIIDFERSGGVTGMILHVSIDSHSLSRDEQEELDRLLTEAGIPEIIKEIPFREPSPDQFTYRLTIQQGEKQHFFQLDEKQIPPSVQPLMRFLTQKSRRKNDKTIL
jgi:hypothetical protein